jgi:hypothetical protein
VNESGVIIDELHRPGIYGPDGKLIPVVDKLAEAKTHVLAADASQRVLEADANFAAFNRDRWRAFIHGTRQKGDATAKPKRISKRRAAAKAAKRTRKGNRT